MMGLERRDLRGEGESTFKSRRAEGKGTEFAECPPRAKTVPSVRYKTSFTAFRLHQQRRAVLPASKDTELCVAIRRTVLLNRTRHLPRSHTHFASHSSAGRLRVQHVLHETCPRSSVLPLQATSNCNGSSTGMWSQPSKLNPAKCGPLELYPGPGNHNSHIQLREDDFWKESPARSWAPCLTLLGFICPTRAVSTGLTSKPETL